MSDADRIHVAQIVTRCIAGAGGVAVRGAINLDAERYRVTLITGEGGALTARAAAAGINVVLEPSLVSPIAPREDARAFRQLQRLCADEAFDVVHTHSAKAGVLGRLAAHRAGVPAIVHTYHGFPFHEFQSPWRRNGYVGIERRVARITDTVLAVGSGVATEALRRGLARPSTLRTVAPVVEDGTIPRDAHSRAAARQLLRLDDAVPVVGTVGRLDYQKAPEHLVAAAARMHHTDAHFVWVGSGPSWRQLGRWSRLEVWPTASTCSANATTWRTCCRPSTSSRCPAATRDSRARWSKRCGAGFRWWQRR